MIAIYALYAAGCVYPIMVGLASVDLILGILFIISYLKTKPVNPA